MDLTHICNFSEASRNGSCWFLALLGSARLSGLVVELSDLRAHRGVNLLNTGIISDRVPNKMG